MNNVIGIIIALLAIVGGGLYFINSQNTVQAPAADVMQKEVAEVMEKGEVMVKDEAVMQKEEAADTMMKKDGETMEKHEGDSMEKEEVMVKEEAVMQKEEVMVKEEPAPVSVSPGSFRAYSSNAVASADGDVVIGFFADWCPSCRALKSDINSDLSAIPAGLTILEANYDTATDLKKRYGVTTQHTLVQVDKNGTLINKWRGGNTLDSVVTRVQ